jgi:hypothetical protein
MNKDSKCKSSGLGIVVSRGDYTTAYIEKPIYLYKIYTDHQGNDLQSHGFINDNGVSSIIPGGDYQMREQDYGKTKQKANAFKSSFYTNVNNTPNPTQKQLHKAWCDNIHSSCENNIVAWGSDLTTFAAAAACPEAGLGVYGAEAMTSLSQSNWADFGKDLAEEFAATTLTIVEVPAWLAAPEVKEAGCYLAVCRPCWKSV